MESIIEVVLPWLVGGVALCVMSAVVLSPLMVATGIYALLGAIKITGEADQVERLLELFSLEDQLQDAQIRQSPMT